MDRFFKLLSKIPLFKNYDFNDKKVRTNTLLGILAVLAIVVYLLFQFISFPGDEKKKAPAGQGQSEHGNVMPAFPAGDDGEADYKSHAEALADARRNQNRVKDIWSQAEQSNSLGSLRSRFDSTVQSGKMPDPSVAAGRTNVFPAQQAVRTDKDAGEAESARREKRRREIMLSNGIDPDTNLPLAYSQQKKQPEQPAGGGNDVAFKPDKQEEQQPVVSAPKVMRRTSSIHTLDGSGSDGVQMGEISSLDRQDEYISEADIHPIKVMFATTEKIKSGQRVYLRLLEDLIVEGTLVPKNTQLPAVVTIGERILVQVNSIELNNRIFTLNYEGYDTDGGRGLYCPQTTANENIKTGINDAANIASSAVSGAIQGYAGQVTNSATNIAKRSINSSTVSVTVASGYTFFLVRKQH